MWPEGCAMFSPPGAGASRSRICWYWLWGYTDYPGETVHVSGCGTDLNHSEFIFLYLSEASYDDVFSLMDLCLWPTLLPLSGQIAAWRIFFRGVAALTSLWMLQDPTCSHRQGFAVCFLYPLQFLIISAFHRCTGRTSPGLLLPLWHWLLRC